MKKRNDRGDKRNLPNSSSKSIKNMKTWRNVSASARIVKMTLLAMNLSRCTKMMQLSVVKKRSKGKGIVNENVRRKSSTRSVSSSVRKTTKKRKGKRRR